jgi:hypothetical protein
MIGLEMLEQYVFFMVARSLEWPHEEYGAGRLIIL